VWRTRELHSYIQTENTKQLRVACSECTCTVYCGCCDNVLHWITLNSSEHLKHVVCCSFIGCGINAFRMASTNSSLAAKSCACAYIAYLAGIFSWYADSKYSLPLSNADRSLGHTVPSSLCPEVMVLYLEPSSVYPHGYVAMS
jgi:hypothetical protein